MPDPEVAGLIAALEEALAAMDEQERLHRQQRAGLRAALERCHRACEALRAGADTAAGAAAGPIADPVLAEWALGGGPTYSATSARRRAALERASPRLARLRERPALRPVVEEIRALIRSAGDLAPLQARQRLTREEQETLRRCYAAARAGVARAQAAGGEAAIPGERAGVAEVDRFFVLTLSLSERREAAYGEWEAASRAALSRALRLARGMEEPDGPAA